MIRTDTLGYHAMADAMQDHQTSVKDESEPRTTLRENDPAFVEEPPKIDAVAVAQSPSPPQEINALAKFASSAGTFAEYPKSSAVWQLYDSGIRGNAMVLLFSIVHGIEAELRETKRELEILRKSHHEECIKSARLESELAAEKKFKKIQTVFTVMGGVVNALAIKLCYDKQQAVGLILLVIGLAMIFAGPFLTKSSDSSK